MCEAMYCKKQYVNVHIYCHIFYSYGKVTSVIESRPYYLHSNYKGYYSG